MITWHEMNFKKIKKGVQVILTVCPSPGENSEQNQQQQKSSWNWKPHTQTNSVGNEKTSLNLSIQKAQREFWI